MKKEELYIINQALDGRDLYGVDFTNEKKLPNLLLDSFKDGLILKGFMEDGAHLSTVGKNIVRDIKAYKSAKKYYSLDNLCIAIVEDNFGIAMIFNPLDNRYKFMPIKLDKNENVLMNYPFFCTASDAEVKEIGVFTKNEIKERFHFRGLESLEFSTSGEKEKTKAFFFVEDKILYIYNEDTNVVIQSNPSHAAKFISERI